MPLATLVSRRCMIGPDLAKWGRIPRKGKGFFTYDKGRLFDDKERASECAFIQKWERQKLEKLRKKYGDLSNLFRAQKPPAPAQVWFFCRFFDSSTQNRLLRVNFTENLRLIIFNFCREAEERHLRIL
eukprot:TRINITY_DN6252_c0_g1_i2.p1 TRINITY_DN6252_c0_g1~~TRINITY_DN6252_c0_g1_i2.p1  ORF type:complete len:128 (-),score=14.99 TRINITY_DN6252_c0_g1_i2:257-640(-)